MGNALTTTNNALELSADEFMEVARNSLYPGALDASIKAVWQYCRAARLDPMQKPVHIVPMSVKKPGTRDEYEWRDIILPGINLYRVQAARSEQHVGTSEPEFGPPVTRHFGRGDSDIEVTFPEWCKVTVSRLKQGQIALYVGKEYWIENYATAGKNTDMPNAMWRKRAYGQLAKCAEAQALRKAFPETSAGETAEEMEGKVIEADYLETKPNIPLPKQLTKNEGESIPMDIAKRETIDQHTGEVTAKPEPSKAEPSKAENDTTPATDGQKRLLRAKLEAAALSDADLQKKFGFAFDGIHSKSQIAAVQAWIANPV
jgi:phage recombination protein Bet